MIQLIVAAFTIGIVGSFHCVGMCGPLAMSLPLQAQQGPKLIGALLYNFGRIITYSLFGLLFGIIGQSVALFGFQQWLSVIAGCIILLFVILPKYITKNNSTTVLRFFEKIRTALGNLWPRYFAGNVAGILFWKFCRGYFPAKDQKGLSLYDDTDGLPSDPKRNRTGYTLC